MILTQPYREVVHLDTKAALLLCGTFTPGGRQEVSPLSLREYNALALWLVRQEKRPANLLQAPAELWPVGEPGLPPVERVRALLGRGVQMAAALERWHRLGLWVISRGEDSYPERLRRLLRSSAPVLLYGAGDTTRLGLGGLAVVGSRDTDEEGLTFTRGVAERCAGAGVQVVSGGARGVDQAAVSAALEAGGGALTVVADRLDRAATSRNAKKWLRSGMLTLVTPYEPESVFTVGRAMGRNKYIYGFADYALVVRFLPGAGGTWAGVIEQLGQNRRGPGSVPVFVRVAGNPQEGWTELHGRGALPFPEESLQEDSITEVLKRTAVTFQDQSGSSTGSPTVPAAPNGTLTVTPQQFDQPLAAAPTMPALVPAQADTCYSRCLPLLLQQIRQEPGEKELPGIAKELDIMPKQIKEWLKRAIEEGKVSRKRKGRRLVYVETAQTGLFHQGGDAA